LQVFCWSSKQF